MKQISYRIKNQIFKKHYRYDLLSYKSINYDNKKESSIDWSLVQRKNEEESFYNYNIGKGKVFGMLGYILSIII